MQYVTTHPDHKALCLIADEVERVYGHDITSLHIGTQSTGATLYVDDRFPTWEQAKDYAHDLLDAAREGWKSYLAAIRS